MILRGRGAGLSRAEERERGGLAPAQWDGGGQAHAEAGAGPARDSGPRAQSGTPRPLPGSACAPTAASGPGLAMRSGRGPAWLAPLWARRVGRGLGAAEGWARAGREGPAPQLRASQAAGGGGPPLALTEPEMSPSWPTAVLGRPGDRFPSPAL